MSLTSANEIMDGKSVRIVRASTCDEYLGKKMFDIRSQHVGRDRFGAGY